MSKWLTNTLTALILLALTSLVGALLKGPIDGFANQNRLTAEVQLAPWVPKPIFPDREVGSAETIILTGKNLKEAIRKLDFKKSSITNFGVAVMNIENSSSNTVKDINIRIDGPFGDPDVAFIDQLDNVHLIRSANRIKLPEMKPGDRIVVYFWGNFSSYNIKEYFRTYSSEGIFRLSFEWPRVRYFEYQSTLGVFLDDYAWGIFITVSLIILIISLITIAVYSEYLKGIFVSPDLSRDEAQKFLSDPKNFQINYAAAQTAWNVHQGRMKAKNVETERNQEEGDNKEDSESS